MQPKMNNRKLYFTRLLEPFLLTHDPFIFLDPSNPSYSTCAALALYVSIINLPDACALVAIL